MTEIKEKCGIFGAYSYRGSDVIPLMIAGLRALQHRGQEAWGITTPTIKPYRQKGLVTENLEKSVPILEKMTSNAAIGHVRYSTVGGSSLKYAQPMPVGDKFAIAHNGTISDTATLEKNLKEHGISPNGCNDTTLAGYRLQTLLKENNWDWYDAIEKLADELVGAYCFLIITNDGKVFAIRDTRGFRPLCIGYHEQTESYIFASESCALYVMGASLVRDVKQGEVVRLDKNGMDSFSFYKGERAAHCAFEYSYFAHPSSIIDGHSVYNARKELGRQLAMLYDGGADVVVPVPDSARPAALGYAMESGIPFEEGLMKDRYAKRGGIRSFIEPEMVDRERINRWMVAVKEIVNNKDVVVVDDSIVRGTSSPNIVKTLRNAGAKSVKMVVTFPPISNPCYAGIDIPTRQELVAYRTCGVNTTVEKANKEVAKAIGADAVGYNGIKQLCKGIGLKETELCLSCNTGDYKCLNRTLD